MPGTKGQSGGIRPGAGRPVETCTLRIGQQLLPILQTPQGPDPSLSQALTVRSITRTRIELANEDDSIRLVFLR